MTAVTIEQCVGLNLRDYRERNELSQAAVGRKLNWSRQAVSLAERGERMFGVSDLLRISVRLGLTITDILKIPAGYDLRMGDTKVDRDVVERTLCLSAITREHIEAWKKQGRYEEQAEIAKLLTRRLKEGA